MVSFASAHSRGLRLKTVYLSTTTLYFASAHSRGLRLDVDSACIGGQSLPQRIRAGCDLTAANGTTLFLSLPQRIRAGCDARTKKRETQSAALPQRIRAGCDATKATRVLKSLLCLSAFARVATAEKQCSALRICCEKVDSFSSVGESGLALTIFPFSFAAKATYVAINDSFGRAIDRFFWCEPHRN